MKWGGESQRRTAIRKIVWHDQETRCGLLTRKTNYYRGVILCSIPHRRVVTLAAALEEVMLHPTLHLPLSYCCLLLQRFLHFWSHVRIVNLYLDLSFLTPFSRFISLSFHFICFLLSLFLLPFSPTHLSLSHPRS